MQEITFITGNPGKAAYLSEHFHIPVAHKKLDLEEIQSLDVQTVVADKAQRAFAIMQTPVLVEDVSLIYTSLKTLPGPFIKWFLESLGTEGLCRLADASPDRSARAEVAFALCDATGVHIFSGVMNGTIAQTPRGDVGFGWDPIFIPEGYTETWAEMSSEAKHASSMRKQPLDELKVFLTQQRRTI